MNGLEFRETAALAMLSSPAAPRIVAIQGASRHLIQALLSHAATTWAASGLRIVGNVEEFIYEPGGERETVVLRD